MSWLSRFKGPWGPLGSLRRIAFLEHLGLGGQGDVWLARDRLLSRLVTVKKVDTAESASQGTLRSLQARVGVADSAIPTVFAVIPDGRKTWLVGEFVKGLPLSELVDELSPENIYLIARDLLSAPTDQVSMVGRLTLRECRSGAEKPIVALSESGWPTRLQDSKSSSRT